MSIGKLDLQSPDFINENFEKLAALFPNCVTESALGKAIDFDLLKLELGHAVIDGNRERYRLEWPGKREAVVTANLPTTKTLRPIREDSVDYDNTENLYIEGDNLEVLKILQESYFGKIKVIYIDPPYNTGKDFVYRDNFTGDKDEELFESGQIDEYNRQLVANPEASGRYHSNWLSMMYPRLKLARNLLAEDGVIFISIDDNEVHNLRKICDELFGDNNFIADLIWTNKEGGGSSDSKLFRLKHEHILCYCKQIDLVEIAGLAVGNEERYKSEDEYVSIRGKYYLQKLGMGSIQYSESLDYPIKAPDGTLINPIDNNSGRKACWRWSKPKYNWGVENGFIVIRKDREGIWTVYSKQYLNCDNEGNLISRTQRPMGVIDEYSSTQASKLLYNLGLGDYFNYSKPKELIEYLIKRLPNNNIILDFFSGSATTAHAVMQLNADDGGNRRYIMVQLPEQVGNGEYKNICEIGKERIRRATNNIKEEKRAKAEKEGMFTDFKDTQDYGFRVYRLADSNMQDVYYRPQDYKQETLDMFDDNIKPDRTPDDLLAQVMLNWGLPLSYKIEQTTINDKQVFKVAQDSLFACFDKGIDEAFAKEIAKEKPLRVVFRDNGFSNDTAKTNVQQLLKQLSPETEMKVI